MLGTMRTVVLGLLTVAGRCFAAASDGADASTLYEAHRWFALRDAIDGREAAPLHRVAVALAFDDGEAGEHETERVLATSPSSEVAAAVHEMLGDFYFRHGRFRAALSHQEKSAALRRNGSPGSDDEPLLRPLARFPELTVAAHRASSIHVWYKNAFVPATINGHRFRCFLDTGANLSVVSESAAKTLGLTLATVRGTTLVDSTGSSAALNQIAVADRLVIGGIHLEHVPFMVVSDRAQPFVEWSAGQRCVLGIQVLLACRTVRWKKAFLGATLELGFPSEPRNLREANLCFDAAMPHVAASFDGRPLDFVLDTGADSSVLDPLFALDFAAYVQANGQKSTKRWEGLVAAAEVATIRLPEFTVQLGGGSVWWRPMEIRPPGKHSDRFHGVIGGEIMQPLREVTFDFGAMKFSLR